MPTFAGERQRISDELTSARAEAERLQAEADRATGDLVRARARVASLTAEYQTYAAAEAGAKQDDGRDLSKLTAREAILALLREARPESVRLRDLDRQLVLRGKETAGGVSVELTELKQAGLVLNPKRGWWTVPEGARP